MYSSKSELGRTYVLPSDSLRELIIRNRRKLNISFDYVNTWKDTHGFGLMLSMVPAGPPKPIERERPDRSFLYKNPAYDLVNI